jgi:hypothetical protein
VNCWSPTRPPFEFRAGISHFMIIQIAVCHSPRINLVSCDRVVLCGAHRRTAWGCPRGWNTAVSGVLLPQGVEGLGMAGPRDTLRSPWPSLATRPWRRRRAFVFLPSVRRRASSAKLLFRFLIHSSNYSWGTFRATLYIIYFGILGFCSRSLYGHFPLDC